MKADFARASRPPLRDEMSDEELIEAMWSAYERSIDESPMRAVLAVVRAHDRDGDARTDSLYIAGMQAGWNYGVVEDRAGFNACVENIRKQLREFNRSKRAAIDAAMRGEG